MTLAITHTSGALPGASAADSRQAARDDLSYFSVWPPSAPDGLHPKVRELLDAAPPVAMEKLPVTEAREVFNKQVAARPRKNEALAQVEDRTIPGPAGTLRVRVYTPQGAGPFPVLAYFHGGGWVFGDLNSHDDVCRSIAHRAGRLVVSVDYRLAPEVRFPGAIEDAAAAVVWISKNVAAWKGDPTKIAVGGDSAGGNIAAGTALWLRDKKLYQPDRQILIYPVTNASLETASYFQNAAGYGLTRDRMDYFWKSYLPKPADAASPYASPLRAPELSGLPPAIVLTAEFDPLRDDGEAYAARLWRAAVPVRLIRYRGVHHGFVGFHPILEAGSNALDEIAQTLR